VLMPETKKIKSFPKILYVIGHKQHLIPQQSLYHSEGKKFDLDKITLHMEMVKLLNYFNFFFSPIVLKILLPLCNFSHGSQQDLIYVLSLSKENWTIIVQVVRLWFALDINRLRIPFSIEFVGSEASIRKTLIYKFDKEMSEGFIYSIWDKSSTTHLDFVFAPHFAFVTFLEIGDNYKNNYLVGSCIIHCIICAFNNLLCGADVMGLFTAIKDGKQYDRKGSEKINPGEIESRNSGKLRAETLEKREQKLWNAEKRKVDDITTQARRKLERAKSTRQREEDTGLLWIPGSPFPLYETKAKSPNPLSPKPPLARTKRPNSSQPKHSQAGIDRLHPFLTSNPARTTWSLIPLKPSYKMECALFGRYVDELNSFLASGDFQESVVIIRQKSIHLEIIFNPSYVEAIEFTKRWLIVMILLFKPLVNCTNDQNYVSRIIQENRLWNSKMPKEEPLNIFLIDWNDGTLHVNATRLCIQILKYTFVKIIDDTNSVIFVTFDHDVTFVINISYANMIEYVNKNRTLEIIQK
ncbi:hypothetical protein CR513_38796, partial [Mucuna pruriens]